MSFWHDFLTHNDKPAGKWSHYFPAYDRHFTSWKDKSITFLEIGTASGGSMQLWRGFFGPKSRIISIDIMPKCKELEEPGTFVRIGDQSDIQFLESLVDEFGVPDIILDDGSHQQHHIIDTFNFFYPKMHKNAVYMVEDLHTSYWPEYNGGLKKPNTFMEFTKDCLDKINARHSRGALVPDYITMETSSISIYDSIVCFEKGDVWWTEPLNRFDKTRF
jgi:hypothetical protein|tara:strand:- start:94 stop:747 length:654 start_codon:yes stop_codon:yes gene_type:complete